MAARRVRPAGLGPRRHRHRWTGRHRRADPAAGRILVPVAA